MIDAKTADVRLLAGDVDGGRKVDPFNYQSNPEMQRPLWMMTFSKSEFATIEDLNKTRELLDKYGYRVTYESVVGESHSPTNKIIQQMFRWLESAAS